MEPTPVNVTIPADAGLAPFTSMAHIYVRHMKNRDRSLLEQLRLARYQVLSNSEDWLTLIQALEYVGQALNPSHSSKRGLGGHRDVLIKIIADYYSRIGSPRLIREAEGEFKRICDLRNDALHSGASARNLAQSCVHFAFKLEEAMLGDSQLVRDVMVGNPAYVTEDDPVIQARKLMISYSFSYVPIKAGDGTWLLISDHIIAAYRHVAGKERDLKMFRSLREAFLIDKKWQLPKAVVVSQDDSRCSIIPHLSSGLLVVAESGRIVGVVAAADLL